MKAAVAVIVLMLLIGTAGFLLLNLSPGPGVATTTVTSYSTVTASTTAFYTTTVALGETFTVTKPIIPEIVAERMEELAPGSTSQNIYHIRLPEKPGEYTYGFGVFWRFGEEHTHTIVFEAPQGRIFTILPSSYIQVRYASARNIPNTPAPIGPNATLTEMTFDGQGRMWTSSWEMRPNIYGIPSRPQLETGSIMVIVVRYTPLEMGEYGESLVARYYFFDILLR
ncbi:hypothetical protein HRbin01_00759 [archaeon HR01]|nr:hypothetical protein HRbin01_00759 [archaeon HR01]